jgi:hypothetical protein
MNADKRGSKSTLSKALPFLRLLTVLLDSR